MSLFVFFISLLIVAQHVSGNPVPIIRSWRLRDVIALCWYVPWLQEGGQVRLVCSASMDGFVSQLLRCTVNHTSDLLMSLLFRMSHRQVRSLWSATPGYRTTSSIFSQNFLSHRWLCGWERCPVVFRFPICLISKRVNVLPINRSGILSNLWNFPSMQIFLIIYHWNTLLHFDCVLCPVVAVRLYRRQAGLCRLCRWWVRFAYKSLEFVLCDAVQTGWRKEGLPMRSQASLSDIFVTAGASRCRDGTRLWGWKVSSDVAASL